MSWAALAKKNVPEPPAPPATPTNIKTDIPPAAKTPAKPDVATPTPSTPLATPAAAQPTTVAAAVDKRDAQDAVGSSAVKAGTAWGGKVAHGQDDFAAALRKELWPLTEAALAAAPIVRQPRGLTNMGNLCFMNAVLQGLVGCSGFFRLLDAIKQRNMVVPTDMPTLNSLVSLASEFIHLEHSPLACAAGENDETSAARGEMGEDGGWHQSGSAQAGGVGSGRLQAKHGPPLTPDYFHEQVNAFAPSDPVRVGRGKVFFWHVLLLYVHSEYRSVRPHYELFGMPNFA